MIRTVDSGKHLTLLCLPNCKLFAEKQSCEADKHLYGKSIPSHLVMVLIHLTSQTINRTTPKGERGRWPAFSTAGAQAGCPVLTFILGGKRVGNLRTSLTVPSPFSLLLRGFNLKGQLTSTHEGEFFLYKQNPASQKKSIKICLKDYDYKMRLCFPISLSVANPQTYKNSLKTNHGVFIGRR